MVVGACELACEGCFQKPGSAPPWPPAAICNLRKSARWFAWQMMRLRQGLLPGTAKKVLDFSLGAGAAGVDRSVLVWEPRTWKVLDRWNNCSKYEVTGGLGVACPEPDRTQTQSLFPSA